MIKDLVFLLMKEGQQTFAQIYYAKDKELKMIDSISGGDVLAIDMIFDERSQVYDIYAIQKKNGVL